MGEHAEYALADAMRSGMRGSGFPRGHMSGKLPCPSCGKGIAGRTYGMTQHLQAKHGLRAQEARELARLAVHPPNPTQET